jgi:hypothetical protein
LEKQEADFRAECRRKRAEMQAHIKQRKDSFAVAAEDDEHSAEVDNAFNVDLQKWITLRSVKKIASSQITFSARFQCVS